MSENPYRAEGGEHKRRQSNSLVRRVVSTGLITVGVFFAIPAILCLNWLWGRLTDGDVGSFLFAVAYLMGPPVVLIAIGLLIHRSTQ
jgi:hypothetical protein